MNSFYEMCQLLESKGIRLTDEIDQQIDRVVPQLLQLAIHSKETGEQGGMWDDENVVTVQYTDQYFHKPRSVEIRVVNEPDEAFHGDFNPIMGVRLNVAHTDLQNITSRWVRRLLAHELGVHSQDPKIADFNTFSKMGSNYSNSGSDSTHYTQPIEFDAYTGQLADSILKAAKVTKGTPQQATIAKMLDDTLTFIRNPVESGGKQIYGIMADPEYWKTFTTYYQYANAQQKRRMYQRIYRAVIDAKQILAQ